MAHFGWGTLIVGCTVAAIGASAATYVDSIAGEGTSKAAVTHGVGQTAGWYGAAAQVPAEVFAEVQPHLANMAGRVGDVAGGVSDGSQQSPPTTVGEGYAAPDGGGQP